MLYGEVRKGEKSVYRETIEPKRGKLNDLAVIMIAFVIILTFEPAMVFANLPQAAKTVGQSIMVIAIVAFCLWFYKKRLCSYRYTFLTDREDVFGELCEKPASFAELSDGTLLIESVVGDGKGTYLVVAAPEEMRAFYTSGENYELPEHTIRIKGTLAKKENACVLVYEQEGRTYAVYFSPGKELQTQLAEMLSTKQDAE